MSANRTLVGSALGFLRSIHVTTRLRYQHHIAGCMILALVFNTGACRSQAPKVNPQEIALPDGEVIGVGSIDDALHGGKLVELVGANLSKKSILIFGVDDESGGTLSEAWGAVSGGMTATIPKNLRKPFYVRVKWSSEYYTVPFISQEWGDGTTNHSIYQSKLVKIQGPIPPNPRVLLVIFYPKDKVVCQVLAEGMDEYDYVAALAKREVIA